MALVGAASQFKFWTISYALKYASAEPIVNAATLFKSAIQTVIGPNSGIWALAMAGAVGIRPLSPIPFEP